MPVLLLADLPARIAQVLKDYHSTALADVDSDINDGLSTTAIAAGRFFEWDRKELSGKLPACTIRPVSTTIVGTDRDVAVHQVDASHRFDVMFHVDAMQTTSPLTLQKYLTRYVTAAYRVLGLDYESLQTSADPTRVVDIVDVVGEVTYGPEVEQEDGAIVRTATIPIAVRRREANP